MLGRHLALRAAVDTAGHYAQAAAEVVAYF
jgi:hypothetical protein